MAVENSATLVPMFLISLRGIFQADYLSTVNLKLGSLFILTVASLLNYTLTNSSAKLHPTKLEIQYI